MTRRLLTVTGLALSGAVLASPAQAAPDRQVILVVSPGVPYEDALEDPFLAGLARAGGIGLLTTSGEAQTQAQAAVSLGAGRSAEGAPSGPVSFEQLDGGLVVHVDPYRLEAGDAEVGLLGSSLAEAGRTVGYIDLRSGQGSPAMLAAVDLKGRIPLAFLNTFPVLGELPPEFLGAGALAVVERSDVVVSPDSGVVEFALAHTPASEVLVLVVLTPPSEEMRERGDTVTPVVMARGAPGELLEVAGRAGGLTSETTRRDGLVSNVDVAPTVLEFVDARMPEEMAGSPIEVAGEAPTDLHRRYLEWREVVTPVGQLALGLAIVSLVAGFVLAVGRWSVPRRAAGAVAVVALGSVALLVVLVPASLLPSFTWPVVLGTLAAGAAVLVAMALRLGAGGITLPLVIVALVGMDIVLIDVAFGWPSGSTPLLGGSALDGERFFGLGNPYAGIVLSGAVLTAAFATRRSGLRVGTALIFAAALLAGLPFLGADLGGAVTLGAVAGLWHGLNRWERLDRRTLALGAAAGLVTLIVISTAHRLAGETHVSRVVSDGLLGGVEIFWERLLLNLRSTSETPSAWLAVLGLPVWLVVALRPPRRLRPVLADDALWGRAVAVLAIGGILGYVLNDTFGMAGIAFLFVSAAVVYPALARRWKGELVTEPSPARAPADG